MTYQECLDKLAEYRDFSGKTVESDGELFKIAYPLICPIKKNQFAQYVEYYINQTKSAENSLSSFINKPLQIVLKGYSLSDDRVALLEVHTVKLVS